MFGFIISKINAHASSEKQMVLEVFQNLRTIDATEEKIESCKMCMLKIVQTNDLKAISKEYKKNVDSDLDNFNYSKLENLVLSKTNNIALGEIFGLLITGGLTVALAIFARPTGPLFDIFALIVSTAVVYISASIYDAYKLRKKQIFTRSESKHNNSASNHYISDHLLSYNSRGERLLLLAMQAITISIFIIIFCYT